MTLAAGERFGRRGGCLHRAEHRLGRGGIFRRWRCAGRVAEEFSGGGDAPAAALRRAGRGAWGGHIRASGCFTTTKLHPSRTDATRGVDSRSLASCNPYIFCQSNDPFWKNHDFLGDKLFMKSMINDPRSIF